MKPFTKNLITYSAGIVASLQELTDRLSSASYAPIGEHEAVSHGFVGMSQVAGFENALVVPFPGGWAACFREDSRRVPTCEVNKHLDERCKDIKTATGRTPGKKERKDLKAEILYELLPRAFVSTKLTAVLYSAGTQNLYVNTSSQKTADRVVTALVRALHSVEFKSLHVSDPHMGLTKRLGDWLKGDEHAFGSMLPVAEVVLADKQRKWAVKNPVLSSVSDTLREATRQGAQVDSICLKTEAGVQFRLTSALRIKGVKHNTVDTEDDMDLTHAAISQLASETSDLDNVVLELLDLLSPDKAQAGDDNNAEKDLFGEN